MSPTRSVIPALNTCLPILWLCVDTSHILVQGLTLLICNLQPLPRGSVPLDGALLLSFCLYSAVLIAACVLVLILLFETVQKTSRSDGCRLPAR